MSEGRRHHGVGAWITNHARGRVCVQQKDADYPRFPLAYSLFGGGREPDEPLADALARELHEELGSAMARRLLVARPRHGFTMSVPPGEFDYSLFEVVVDDDLLDALTTHPVLEGERAAVVSVDAVTTLAFIWGLEHVVRRQLELELQLRSV